MSTRLPPSGTPPDPLEWRRKFLERRYREEYLPEMHHPFEVDGIPLNPAEALEKCRPDQYQVALTEYARHEGEAALENACHTFPAPVAIALYRALNSASNEHERLMHYRDAAEALILLLLAVVVGECRAKGVQLKGLTFSNPSGNQEKLTAKKLLTDSVAHRLAMLDGILTGLVCHPALVLMSQIPRHAVERLKEFKDIRNDFSHYQAMSEPEAALVCQDLREQLADAMLAFESLAETEIVVFDRHVQGNSCKFEIHSGSSQNKKYQERTLTPGAREKCLALTAEQRRRPLFHYAGDTYEATPFLHSALTTKGHRRHIWILKRAREGNIEYEIAGEREVCAVADSVATVELKVLDELFS